MASDAYGFKAMISDIRIPVQSSLHVKRAIELGSRRQIGAADS
jgi:hypothetical protein